MPDLNEDNNATDRAETQEQNARSEAATKLSHEFSGVKLFISELETQRKSSVIAPTLELNEKAVPGTGNEFVRSTKYPPEATTMAVGEEGLGPKPPETSLSTGEDGTIKKPCPDWSGGSTKAAGEEGSGPKPEEWMGGSTKMVGEEGSAPKPE